MTDPHTDPVEALASIRQSRGAVQARVSAGSWTYDIVYSLLVGTMVAGVALPLAGFVIVDAVCSTALVLLALWWARRNGVWVSGLTPRRARWVAIGLGLAFGGLVLSALVLKLEMGLAWAPLALGVLAAGLALAASRLWLRVYRSETGAEA